MKNDGNFRINKSSYRTQTNEQSQNQPQTNKISHIHLF